MSIASRITSIEEHIGNAYDSINKFGVDTSVINKNIENIANVINDEIYDKLPKVTGNGSEFTLTPVQNGQVDDFKMIGTDLYQNQLPSEYTAVEYLQSDNECYIDTGINADYKLSLKIKIACLNSTQQHMGAINNTGSSYIRHHITFNPSQPQDIGIYIGQTNNQLSLKSFDNNFHEFNLDIYNKKISIDNDSAIAIAYNNFDVGINYYLFARNGSNIAISKGSYKIAYCKMYYEDNLVRDFAPCYRNSDNVAGLYDFVTNTFFTNQGTGTFTVGNNITLPNPNYPQEIKVVEGRQVITDSGKNLFDVNQTPHSNSLPGVGVITTINNDGTISTSGTNSETYRNIRYDIQLPAGEYIISGCPAGGSKNGYSSLVQLTEETSSQIFDTGNGASFTLTETTTVKFYPVRVGSETVNFNGLIFKPMIMLANLSDDTFEPYYNPVSYNIDLHGKNYFDGQYEDGYYNNSNGTKNSIQDPYGCRSTNKNEVKPNENYIISVNNVVTNLSIRLFYYDINRNFLSTDTTTTGIFTTPNDCYFIAWHSSALKQNYPDGIPNMMIENNSQVTSYEEYYNYKLAKMPNTDYKNRIYKNNGNWYYEKNVEKIILDGNATWYKYNNNFCLESITNYNRVTNIPICTHFKGINMTIGTSISIEDNDKTIRFGNNENASAFRVFIIDSDFSDAGVLKNFLLTHNVELWYILATPVTTQITDTTLINQLEAISTFKGTNIFTISNDNNVIPEIEVTRLKELERLQ